MYFVGHSSLLEGQPLAIDNRRKAFGMSLSVEYQLHYCLLAASVTEAEEIPPEVFASDIRVFLGDGVGGHDLQIPGFLLDDPNYKSIRICGSYFCFTVTKIVRYCSLGFERGEALKVPITEEAA
ncbi:hypothetical protein V6N12_062363 [Hibiscus sabdariffa]|uniref:Uncharacterized protein n=1 Tax=Hibiscus sabdariffa TaxID=183260 RepID=A0ABR2F8S0_9ROSI